MKIVIDIPKYIYEHAKEQSEDNNDEWDAIRAIANGTPLPKHHGRLIDADALEYTCNADECGMLTGCNHCQYHIVTEHEIVNAPTIIGVEEEE